MAQTQARYDEFAEWYEQWISHAPLIATQAGLLPEGERLLHRKVLERNRNKWKCFPESGEIVGCLGSLAKRNESRTGAFPYGSGGGPGMSIGSWPR